MRRSRLVASVALVSLTGCSGYRDRPGAPDGDSPPPAFSSPPRRDAAVAPTDVVAPAQLPIEALRNPLSRETSPPPISGGTLLAMRDGETLAAADPDRDAVWIARTTDNSLRRVALAAGDEPGRIVEDDRGLLHVALRRGGAVATIDPASATVVTRRALCPAPRGLAWDDAAGALLVACAGGEFVTVSRNGEARAVTLDDDLRDVVVWSGRRFVTRFRRAELIEVNAVGSVVGRAAPPPFSGRAGSASPVFEPGVAWRTIAHPRFGIVMLHQLASTAMINLSADGGVATGAYGGASGRRPNCEDRIVVSALSVFNGTTPTNPNLRLPTTALAVDLAAIPDAVVVAGPGEVIAGLGTSQYPIPTAPGQADCLSSGASFALPQGAQVTAVAALPSGRRYALLRAPAGITALDDRTVPLRFSFGDPMVDSGHVLFHLTTGAGIACASCHPEGGEDGRVWHFAPIGRRRTPPLRGATSRTAPFHWDGDQADFAHLLDDVFSRRMSGGALTPALHRALSHWVDGLPVPRTHAPAPAEVLARGRAVFEGPAGCADCHAGEDLTNNESVDVGTGGSFQVPPLRGLAGRAPYLHDGRAATLESRLMMSDGDRHGRTAALTVEQRADLLRYLESL